MLLRKYRTSVIVKHSLDEDEIREVSIWASPEEPDDVYNTAWKLGYEVVPSAEIWGTEEYDEFDEFYIDDRLEFDSEFEE